ncbi:hypothetical protein CIB95_13275 [Lottiidibacillus patelloidae]|uniref:General stress protein n=1 Tax=Lottiidibacillus patelloidae TaxID=2670334 RepID=A0A263BQU9_9BACI|nr:YtxH domain-containing protein [Lottiidibacillus patelloidae]OZM56075.1 hypothetical protein CIB95_13275 [Lottiidibacillus patelloidae]
MSKDMKKSSKNFMMGTVIGGVIGAFSALLFAPKSGKELRHDIETKSNEVAKKTTELTNEVAKKATDLSNDVRESSKELANYANEKKVQLTEHSKQVIEKVKDWKDTTEEEVAKEDTSEEVTAVENK